MSGARPGATTLAVLFLLLFLGCLGVRFWASGEHSRAVGPDHVAAGSGRVYVHLNGELWVLSDAGTVLQRQPVSALDLDDSPIDLRALADGRLLVIGQQPTRFRLCDPVSWQCTDTGRASAQKIRAQLKAVVDAEGNLLVADFRGRAVWREPLADGEATRIADRDQLAGPNDLALDGTGRLWVADSAGRRLVSLKRDAGGAWEPGGSIDARHKFKRGKRSWPMMIAVAADDLLWVVQPDRHGDGADLIVYHPERGALARVALPEEAHPTDIVGSGPEMLVTDAEQFRIYRVDATSRAVSEFGDPGFQAEMRQRRAAKARFRLYSQAAMAGIVLFALLMIGAAFVATPKGKRWTKATVAPPLAAAAEPGPVLDSIHWLKRDPKADRRLQFALYASYVAPLIVLIGFGVVYFTLGDDFFHPTKPEAIALVEKLKHALIVVLLFVGGMPFLAAVGSPPFRARLGSDGYRLFARYPDGRQVSFAPEQLVYSDQVIACRNQRFVVQTARRQPLYAEREVETFIAPLLRNAKKVSALQMVRYQFVHRDPALMVTLAYVVLLMVALVATVPWEELLKRRTTGLL